VLRGWVSGQWLHPATDGDLAACLSAITPSQSDAFFPASLHLPAAALPPPSPAGSPQPEAGALASCARAIEESMGLQPGAQLPLATLLERLPRDPPVTGEQRREGGGGFHGRCRPGRGRQDRAPALPLLCQLQRLQQLPPSRAPAAAACACAPSHASCGPPSAAVPCAADKVEVYKVPDSDPREKLRCAPACLHRPPACLPGGTACSWDSSACKGQHHSALPHLAKPANLP
jgi:hypothetical protein